MAAPPSPAGLPPDRKGDDLRISYTTSYSSIPDLQIASTGIAYNSLRLSKIAYKSQVRGTPYVFDLPLVFTNRKYADRLQLCTTDANCLQIESMRIAYNSVRLTQIAYKSKVCGTTVQFSIDANILQIASTRIAYNSVRLTKIAYKSKVCGSPTTLCD